MPPINYIWMRTNLNNELIGVYEWLNGAWHRIKFGGDTDYRDTYSKAEIEFLLQYTEEEIIRKLLEGEYDITDYIIDNELSLESSNPVQNKVVTAALSEKVDKADFDAFKDTIPGLAGINYGNTEYWNSQSNYIPKQGEIIIYSDYGTKVVNGELVNVPGIKIGSGNAYVQDLVFVGDDLADALYSHIMDTAIHVTARDKDFWNNKLNVDDDAEVINGSLIFNRN